MRFEVVQEEDAWIVRSEGLELARFDDQDTALIDVADIKGGSGQASLTA